MTQAVWAHLFFDARRACIITDQLPERLACHRRAAARQEDGALRRLRPSRPDLPKIALDRLARLETKRHDAPLRALTHDRDEAFMEVQIHQLKADELGDPEPRGVKEIEHGAIADGARFIARGRVQEAKHLVLCERFGELAESVRVHKELGRIARTRTLFDEKAEETADRGEMARLASSGEAAPREAHEVGGDISLVDGREAQRPLLHIFSKRFEIRGVGLERLFREAHLHPKPAQVKVNSLIIAHDHVALTIVGDAEKRNPNAQSTRAIKQPNRDALTALHMRRLRRQATLNFASRMARSKTPAVNYVARPSHPPARAHLIGHRLHRARDPFCG